MPRQARIEFEGARYHVMARGDRRKDIFLDDEDRRHFLSTIEEAYTKTGWRIHAYVLMRNHYHLLLETPRANLVSGMSWLQSAYTIRFNARHRLSGHLFGGRYKAILVDVESVGYFEALLDYIHLNPVRAGIVRRGQPIESYPWSSLSYYRLPPSKRQKWQEAVDGIAVRGLKDTAKGRRAFLEALEGRMRHESAHEAGLSDIEGQSLQSTLHRGWYFGSQAFAESLIVRSESLLKKRKRRRDDGYHGRELRAHDGAEARRIIAAGLREFALKATDLPRLKKNDWRKGLIAHLIRENTTMSLDWISGELVMGARSATSRNATQMGQRARRQKELARVKQAIAGRARIHD